MALPVDVHRVPATVAVVVPTYRRPDFLDRCLVALRNQARPADELVVVARPDDEASWAVARRHDAGVRAVAVHEPGVIAALRTGAAATTSDVIAFTDDDAEPPPDWVGRLLDVYTDRSVGGVGGRDVVVGQPPRPGVTVGRISRWGKLTGNHSQGSGPARDVDVLKGVNLSFRREAMALPDGYRGMTTQAHWEVAMSLWARSGGWRLVYDPSIVVTHHEGPRSEAVSRERWRSDATSEAAYNLVGGMLAADPSLFWRRAAYGLLVGDRGTPGLVRAAVSLLQRRPHEAIALGRSLAGQLAALRDIRRGRGPTMCPVHPRP